MIWVWRFLEKLNNVVVEIFRQGRVRGTMVLRQCPFCHRPFEAEALAKEQVDSSEVTKVSDFPIETNRVTGQTMEGGFAIGRDLLFVLSEDERNIVAMRSEAYITCKVSYECKHCGKKMDQASS